MRVNKAFTLAEVLITLGIIGVVAALTIPGVIQKQKEKATVVKLKKAYSTIQNAYRLAQEEYGYDFAKDVYNANSSSLTDSATDFMEKLKPFLSVAVDCKDTPNLCFSTINGRSYYYVFLEQKGTTFWNGYSQSAVLLKDGTLIVIYMPWYRSFTFLVDVNGPQKPNSYGHDTFFFEVNWYDNVNKISPYKNNNNCKLNSTNQATGCAWWVLINENMDYLHCNLNWQTQTKCN